MMFSVPPSRSRTPANVTQPDRVSPIAVPSGFACQGERPSACGARQYGTHASRGGARAGILRDVEIATTDSHTAGEPFRIVGAGAVEIPGDSVLARRERAQSCDEIDRVRQLL